MALYFWLCNLATSERYKPPQVKDISCQSLQCERSEAQLIVALFGDDACDGSEFEGVGFLSTSYICA
ncbi:hypothetical protein LENED_008713 [Lentinula edodes]|uniref:Uncharacterized protein n=1 Tax=Lentinula edodes TaxID=5353 RepID=A0A1Q3EHR8_LENED|nr:hypothetical protein LENED_008713 [Lentinula edodes]